MLKQKIDRLINDYGVKKEKIIETLDSNRVTFGKKYKDNSFDVSDNKKLMDKYGALLS